MSNRDLFVRIKAKTVTVSRVFEKIVSSVEGFRVQTPTDGRRSDLLILEVGDDVEKELEVIASLATSNVAGEIFLTSKQPDSILLVRAMQLGTRELFTQPLEEKAIAAALERFKGRVEASGMKRPAKLGQKVNVIGSKGNEDSDCHGALLPECSQLMADSSHSILIPGEWSPGIPANLRGAFFHLALVGLSDATLADMNFHLPIFSQLIPFKQMRVGYLGLLLIPCLYWFAFKDITAPTLLSALNHWEISSLVVLGLLNLLILQGMSLRWGQILEHSGHRVPLFQLVFYRLGANAISYLTPGPQFGGEPFQVHWLIRCHGIIPEVAAASVFVDRLVAAGTSPSPAGRWPRAASSSSRACSFSWQ